MSHGESESQGEHEHEGEPQRGVVSRRAGVLRVVGLDIVGPLVVYRACRAAGVDEVWSLVVAGCLPGAGVLIDWLRWRTLEVVGAVVLGGIGLGIVLALVTDSPKGLLFEGAAITGLFGVGCLVSLRARRPLIFYFGQGFSGGRHSAEGAEIDRDYDEYEEARFFWRLVTVVWGVTHIALAIALGVVIQVASTGTALTVSRTVPWVLTGGLITWALWWGERLKAQKPVAD